MPRWLRHVVFGFAGLCVITAAAVVLLIAVTKLPGEEKTPSGVRRNTAQYIRMRDGVEIAADVWLPWDYQTGQRLPVLMRTTRYGRDGQFGWEFRLLVGLRQTDPHGPGDGQTDYLNSRHFVVMVADARGCGASGGHRESEFSPEEIADLGELAHWAARQSWSNGRVGTFGGSYEGAAAELTAAANEPAVKAVAAFSSQFDFGRLVFPGGIYSEAFVQSWSDLIKKLDNSDDLCFTQGVRGLRCWWAGRYLRGVKRVDGDRDGTHLDSILAQRHNGYPVDLLSRSEFPDDRMYLRDGSSTSFAEMSPFGHRHQIEDSHVAMQVWCGWLDATVCEGALSRYVTLRNPQQMIVGAFSHDLSMNTDPFTKGDRNSSVDPAVTEQNRTMADFFDRMLRSDVPQPIESGIRYYTMGQRQWHETKVWPPPGFESRSRLYFGASHELSVSQPTALSAIDDYAVNFIATTGKNNRWSAEMNQDILFPDRSSEDGKLLVYTGAPLATDVEITGSPMVALQVASSATDGAFFVYLEDVGPDGLVTLLDDGQQRAVSRTVEDLHKRHYELLSAVPSSSRDERQPFVRGKPVELTIPMWPTSLVLRKGHRLRIALAGADTCFRRYPPAGNVTWTVYRQRTLASYVELPMRFR